MKLALNSLRIAAASLVAAAATITPAHAAALYPDRPDLFPIGVWQQATFNFDTWRSRGANTLVNVPGGHDKQRKYWSDWHDQAVARGFEILRQPNPNVKLATDVNAPKLRAMTLRDEPDYNDYPASTLQADYNRIKAARPTMPVFVNYSGGVVLSAQRTRGGTPSTSVPYSSYLSATDWVSNSIYPVTGWNRPDWIDHDAPTADGPKKNPGLAVDRLRALAPAKPQWAVIETSDQNLPWQPGARGVTAPEYRGQVWHSIIHGANGIIYFPQEIGSFRFDATPAAVAQEMLVQHPRIQQIAKVLNSNYKPAATPGHTDPAEHLAFLSADARIEGSWHQYKDGDYFVVLNMSGAANDYSFTLKGAEGPAWVVGAGRSIADDGADRFTDAFEPWATHIYKFASAAGCEIDCASPTPPMLALPAIPEPSTATLLATAASAALLARRRDRRRSATT